MYVNNNCVTNKRIVIYNYVVCCCYNSIILVINIQDVPLFVELMFFPISILNILF